jgi:glucokinase
MAMTKNSDSNLKESDFKAENIFAAAIHGDPLCQEIVDDLVRHLALAVATMINILDVHTFIFGGGVIKAQPGILDGIRPLIKNYLYDFEDPNRV